MNHTSEDAKTTRWYRRYHKAAHKKADRFGGYPFGDPRCPICQLWSRVAQMKRDARRLKVGFEAIVRRAKNFEDLLDELGRE
jgi:hypothetical protein